MESSYCKTLAPMNEWCTNFIPFFTQKIFSVVAKKIWKRISKIKKLTNFFLGEMAVRSQGQQADVTLIYPVNYKSQIFTNVVLQSLVDKYVTTYQNTWSEGVVRLHWAIVMLGKLLIDVPNIPHFLQGIRSW